MHPTSPAAQAAAVFLRAKEKIRHKRRAGHQISLALTAIVTVLLLILARAG